MEGLRGGGVLDRIREEVNRARERLKGVKRKTAVISVKGGVGKSFIVANLAVALAERGRRVGVFDADVHVPSIPQALVAERGRLWPPRAYCQQPGR